ncbi:MAG TPA: two-component regulator propeller domain-containing protein [Chitinophagaceae bacterium]|nr:two-component regulator propeller domain-containing protein [Chitinophagaceae bacterium]
MLVCLLAVTILASSQQKLGKTYLIRKFDDKTSLPQNSVRSILFDKHGFMWMGTELGLVRFDGQEFKIYNKTTHPGIIFSNRIQALAFLHDSLICLDGNYHPIYINTDCLQFTLLKNIRPWENFFWTPVGTDLRNARQEVSSGSTFPTGIGPVFLLPDKSVYSLENEFTYFYIKDKKATVEMLPTQLYSQVALPVENSLYILSKTGKMVELHNGVPGQSLPLLGDMAGAIQKGSKEPSFYIRIFTSDGFHFVQVKNQLFSLNYTKLGFQSSLVIDSLPATDIQSLAYVDSLGLYCLGTYTQGLHILRKKNFTAITNPLPGINLNNNYAQALLANGSIFTSTGFLVDTTGRFTERFREDLVSRFTTLKDTGSQIYFSYKNRMWVADSNLQNAQAVNFFATDIRGMLQANNGNIYYAIGESLHQLKNGRDTSITKLPPASVIETIFSKSNTTLWLGTRIGLFSFDVQTSAVTRVKEFDSVYVRTITQTSDGAIWLGSYGDGFFLYTNNRFIKMPVDENGYLLTAHCFIEDKNRFLWIPTNKGLFQFYIPDLLAIAGNPSLKPFYKYYDESAGFNTNEFNGGCVPCSITMKNGTVSLPSLNGLVWFNPLTMSNSSASGGLFTEMIIQGMDTLLCPNEVSKLSLDYQANELEIRVSSPNLFDSRANRYEFLIEGGDNGWMPLDNNTLRLRKLGSGTHIVLIRKQNGFGIDNYSYKRYEVYVATAWYASWWFILLALGVLVLTVRFIIRQRVKYLQQQNKKLEAIIEERTADLKKSNQMKDKLTAILIHDIRSPLRFISLFASHIKKGLDAGDRPANLLSAAADLRKATDEVYNFVDESVIWIKAQQKGFSLQRKPFQVFGLVSELEDFFDALLKENNNRMTNEVDPNIMINSYREIVKVIVRNFIDNANKYTSNGHIIVSASTANEATHIIIKDDGPGISEELVKYFKGPAVEDSDVHIGLGFRIIKEMLLIIDGNLEINSSAAGTSVTIILK